MENIAKIYIVTDSEAGWDCIISAHANLDDLKKYFDVPQEINGVIDVQEYIRKNETVLYVIHVTTLIK